MRFDILTLFPAAVAAMMQESILGRGQKKGLIDIRTHQIRDYTANKQNQVDDYPYGGGRGAVMPVSYTHRCAMKFVCKSKRKCRTAYLFLFEDTVSI